MKAELTRRIQGSMIAMSNQSLDDKDKTGGFLVEQIAAVADSLGVDRILLSGLHVRLSVFEPAVTRQDWRPSMRIEGRKLKLDRCCLQLVPSAGWNLRMNMMFPMQNEPHSGELPREILDWEILPPDFWEQQERCLGTGNGSEQSEKWERIQLVRSLAPTCEFQGNHSGLRYYYAFVFPTVVIAESAQFGNAIYYYETDNDSWQTVFRKSKSEALDSGARRMVHSGDWPGRLIRLVGAHVPCASAVQRQ